jgi:dolichol kinase
MTGMNAKDSEEYEGDVKMPRSDPMHAEVGRELSSERPAPRDVPSSDTSCSARPTEPTASDPKPRLSSTELRRRLWHMAPGLLPLLLWPFPHRDPLSFRMRLIILSLGCTIAGAIFIRYRRIQRVAGDVQRLSAVAGYALSVLATLFLLPDAAEIGMTVLALLAFGDGSATLGGLLFDGPALPWNPRKSWSGLASFVVVGTLAGAVIYWGESHNLRAVNPGASWGASFLIAGGACLAAAIAESIPSRINDNVRVGTTAALSLTLLHSLVVGW